VSIELKSILPGAWETLANYGLTILKGRVKKPEVFRSLIEDLCVDTAPKTPRFLTVPFYNGKPYVLRGLFVSQHDPAPVRQGLGDFVCRGTERFVTRYGLGFGNFTCLESTPTR